MRSGAEATPARRAVAVASALLQAVASLQLTVALAWVGALFSAHAHEHTLTPVRDGHHFDIVLSHDAARDTHEHARAAHLHGSPADDHVVHLAGDEMRDPRRAQPTTLPVALASAHIMISPPRSGAVSPPPRVRPVLPLSRRSVVLRT